MGMFDWLVPPARIEGAEAIAAGEQAKAAHGENGKALERIVGFYKTAYPERWNAMRLGPACDALDQMIAELKR